MLKKLKQYFSVTPKKKNKTTLEILEEIILSFRMPLDPTDLGSFRMVGDEITFTTERTRARAMRHYLPSIRESIPGLEHSFHHYNSRGEERQVRYKVDLAEYNAVFKESNSIRGFINNDVKNMFEVLRSREAEFRYLLNQYELSLYTLLTTIKENKELNGNLDKEIEDMAKKLLSNMIISYKRRKKDIELLDKKLKQATNQSHIERLRNEVEYVSTFLEKGDD